MGNSLAALDISKYKIKKPASILTLVIQGKGHCYFSHFFFFASCFAVMQSLILCFLGKNLVDHRFFIKFVRVSLFSSRVLIKIFHIRANKSGFLSKIFSFPSNEPVFLSKFFSFLSNEPAFPSKSFTFLSTEPVSYQKFQFPIKQTRFPIKRTRFPIKHSPASTLLQPNTTTSYKPASNRINRQLCPVS